MVILSWVMGNVRKIYIPVDEGNDNAKVYNRYEVDWLPMLFPLPFISLHSSHFLWDLLSLLPYSSGTTRATDLCKLFSKGCINNMN